MKWMICVNNEGYAASLEARKLYLAQRDEKAEQMGLLRVIDESGESYLYPQDRFLPMRVAAPLEERLLAVA